MKRNLLMIISMMLVLTLALPTAGVFATDTDDDPLFGKFRDYCVEALPEGVSPGADDAIEVIWPSEVNGVTFFVGNCGWVPDTDEDCIRRFGDWNVLTFGTYFPYALGAYACSGDEIYTLEEAYELGFIQEVTEIQPYLNGYLYFFQDYVADPDNKYEEYVVKKAVGDYNWIAPYFEKEYREVYEYYSSSSDEATPDYVLVYLKANLMGADICIDSIFYDKYILSSGRRNNPFSYYYGIYVPSSGEVYDLPDAYKAGVEGLENVFTEVGIGKLLGDMDSNRVLNVKDATCIQKCLAGIEKFDPYDYIFAAEYDDTLPLYYCDFNFDHKRDIKDATAIQKHIAGLEYR